MDFEVESHKKIWKTHVHRGSVGQLPVNRSGHSDMLGLSTARDLFISAIISGIFFVERVVKVLNIQRNIAFFEPRSSEQPIYRYTANPWAGQGPQVLRRGLQRRQSLANS